MYRSKNIKRKGFTLVELAIVLVVIGILLSLAIKGIGLVEVARVKADINKLRKIGAGIAQYELVHGEAPGQTGPEIFDNLTKTGLLGENDFTLNSLPGKYWTIIPCATDPKINEGWFHVTNRNNQYSCAYLVDKFPDTESLASTSVPAKFLCYIETLYDDKNWLQGDGRMAGALRPEDILTKIPNWDCSKASEGNTTSVYLYRVF